MLPVLGVRVLDGRVGSTLLLNLLATSSEVATERRYPAGERRYASWCVRTAEQMTEPWDDARHPGVTAWFFDEPPPVGPLPWTPQALDLDRLRVEAVRGLWSACSAALLAARPGAGWYAEKVAVPVETLLEAGIELRVVDLVRDPRDVLASIRAFVARTGHDGFGRIAGEAEERYAERFVESTAARLDVVARPLPGVERLVLRYEEWAIDLPGTAARVGEWLGVGLDARGLADRAAMAEHVTTDSVEASVGRWRTDLPPGEAEQVWEALGSRLEPLGYCS
jgi:hypothetical protein